MNKVIAILILAIVTVVIGYFIYFLGKDHTVRISEEQIKLKMSEKLPVTKNYLFIFKVTLDNPRIDLLSESKRIKAGLDVTLTIKIGRESNPLNGLIDVSGELKYVSEKGQFFLTDMIIEQVSIDGVPEKYSSKVTDVFEKALSEYYSNHPVYVLSNKDIKQAAAKLVLKDVQVDNNDLVVTLAVRT